MERAREGEPRARVLSLDVVDAGQRWTLFVALAVLNLLDVFTTAWVLERGGTESNPIVAPLVQDMTQVAALKVAVLVIVAGLLVRASTSRVIDLALTLATGWYLAVVGWNFALLALV